MIRKCVFENQKGENKSPGVYRKEKLSFKIIDPNTTPEQILLDIYRIPKPFNA